MPSGRSGLMTPCVFTLLTLSFLLPPPNTTTEHTPSHAMCLCVFKMKIQTGEDCAIMAISEKTVSYTGLKATCPSVVFMGPFFCLIAVKTWFEKT